jgi:hypothetical protein
VYGNKVLRKRFGSAREEVTVGQRILHVGHVAGELRKVKSKVYTKF